MKLRYGMNPHQRIAEAVVPEKAAFEVLNGQPGFINLLDALNGWQLVKELREISGLPAAASFKHVNPAGAAIGKTLPETLRKSYLVEGMELSPLATAYARARGTDRMASYGDFVALSDIADSPTAVLLSKEVSDGVIAPGYEKSALETLRKKKNGKYLVLRIDPDYRPPEIEAREVFGFVLRQSRNDLAVDDLLLAKVVTAEKSIPPQVRMDMLLGLAVQKYTQSNSINVCHDGQTIGVGAGQQSRIQCTRIAIAKAETWFLRQSGRFDAGRAAGRTNRNETDNGILTTIEGMGAEERTRLLSGNKDWVLVSDGYIPFPDNVEAAHAAGIRYIVQPGSSLRDDEVIGACDRRAMVMVFTGKRFFTH